MIWQICSGVNFGGAPAFGKSANRLATLNSSSGTSANCSQRLRQCPGVSSSTPNSRAICKLFHPSPASSTMRARNASCWAVLYARTKRSSSARSLSLSTTLGGFGVAIVYSGQIRMPNLTRRPRQPGSPKSRHHSAHVY